MKLLLSCLLLIGSISLLNGCFFLLGAGVGAGGYSFLKGELRQSYPVGVGAAYDASLKALLSLSLEIEEKRKDMTRAKIVARRKDGRKIVLSLNKAGPRVTSIGVRIGAFGNRKESEHIHDRLHRHMR